MATSLAILNHLLFHWIWGFRLWELGRPGMPVPTTGQSTLAHEAVHRVHHQQPASQCSPGCQHLPRVCQADGRSPRARGGKQPLPRLAGSWGQEPVGFSLGEAPQHHPGVSPQPLLAGLGCWLVWGRCSAAPILPVWQGRSGHTIWGSRSQERDGVPGEPLPARVAAGSPVHGRPQLCPLALPSSACVGAGVGSVGAEAHLGTARPPCRR